VNVRSEEIKNPNKEQNRKEAANINNGSDSKSQCQTISSKTRNGKKNKEPSKPFEGRFNAHILRSCN
jgi:hypothetical protein